MLECLTQRIRGRHVLIALLVFTSALIAMNIAATRFYHSTGGYGILDLGGGANLLHDLGSYSPARAYMLITRYGPAGIRHYYRLLIADIFFPPGLGVFASLAIVWALAGIAPRRRWVYLLALVPLAYVIADWSENIGITIMLTHFPQRLYLVARLTNIARGCKSFLANSALLITLFSWITSLWIGHRRMHCHISD